MAVLLIGCGAALAQTPLETPVKWKTSAPTRVSPGAWFEVKVNATIEPGWHLYSVTQPPGGPFPTRFTVLPGSPFQAGGEVRQSPPEVIFDPNFGINTESFAGSAEFSVPVKAAENAGAGDHEGRLQVQYQMCNDQLCLPPTKFPLPFGVTIAERSPAPAAEPSQPPPPALNPAPVPPRAAAASPQPAPVPTAAQPHQSAATPPPPEERTTAPAGTAAEVAEARAGGLWPFMWLAMTMGALSLATPCVFPMIPITVSYFTKKAERSRSSGLAQALVYCFGIIFTFTGLGLGLAALLGATGINQFAANPWVNLVITAIFVGFALNLFGLYQIGVSSGLLTKLSKAGEGGGYVGSLLMGLTFTLTSFTCTVPFVGTVLVATAQGDWLWPALGMLGFSVVFAAPFFVLAMLPRYLTALPRSGGWLNSVKVTMGFLEIAAAMKFVSNVDLVWNWHIFTREVVLSIWVALAVLATIYLLGKFQLPHDSPVQTLGVMRLMWAMCFLSIGFFLFTGLMGGSLGELDAFLPPRTAGAQTLTGGGSTPGKELTWLTERETALAQARRSGRPIFIDFTGYTCTNCRWMEANIFTLPAVQSELEKFVRLQLYTDGAGKKYEENQQYQKDAFGTVALPLYVILDSEGRTLAMFPGITRKPDEFLRFLRTPFAKTSETVASVSDGSPAVSETEK